MPQSMQQHVETLDKLKQSLVDLGGDPLRKTLIESDLVELALSGDLDALKAFSRDLYRSFAGDMVDEVGVAGDSAEIHANTVVKMLKS